MNSETGRAPGTRRDPYAALRYKDFRLLLTGRVITSFSSEMLSLRDRVGVMAAHAQRAGPGHGRSGAGDPGAITFADRRPCGRSIQPETDRTDHGGGARAMRPGTGRDLLLSRIDLSGLFMSGGDRHGTRLLTTPPSSTLVPETIPPALFSSAATWNSSSWQFALPSSVRPQPGYGLHSRTV